MGLYAPPADLRSIPGFPLVTIEPARFEPAMGHFPRVVPTSREAIDSVTSHKHWARGSWSCAVPKFKYVDGPRYRLKTSRKGLPYYISKSSPAIGLCMSYPSSQPTHQIAIMSSTSEHDPLEVLLTRLSVSLPSTPCRTLFPQLQPSIDEILRTLSPTDAEVFRSALAGDSLIPSTPPFVKQYPPIPSDPFIAQAAQLLQSQSMTGFQNVRQNPVLSYGYFSGFNCPGSGMLVPGADDLRYAARAALGLTTAELDDKMRLAVMACCNTSWETFRPLVCYRLACAAALGPLIDLGPPPAALVGEYAWTWRTCASCARHTGRGRCGMFCADAPWFVELWEELVAILRARPDPEAVFVRGRQHFSEALKAAMECPTCAKVAQEHLKCFEGLLVVEAAKRIAEVPFEL